MAKVSVLIPARAEQYLARTVEDVLKKATGDIEVIVVLEGYWPNPFMKDDPRLVVIHHPVAKGMRTSLNDAAAVARGEFLMKLDAHCLLAEGFDEVLKADCPEYGIIAPRRYSLEPEPWTIREYRPYVDYEFISFPYRDALRSVRVANKWWDRAEARKDVLIDETMTFQGSCMFMPRTTFDRIGPFQTEGYGEFILDAEEFALKVWLSGGCCRVTKRTWYAHLHKSQRGYMLDRRPLQRGRIYHIDYWMHDRWPKQTLRMADLVERFWPIPTWPADWQDPKYEAAYWKAVQGGV